MKNFIFVFLLLGFGAFFALGQSPTISWPVNYCVFQRNSTGTGGSTDVTFAGQVFDKSGMQYRIEKLTKTGSYSSDYKSYQSLPGGSTTNIGSSSAYFYFSLNIPVGWYRFTIKDGAGSTQSLKFGVGEVFIIAGQSNAQGFGTQQEITGLSNYDCVVALKNTAIKREKIEVPVFNVLNPSNKSIGPFGDRPWFYQSLGNKIVDSESGQVIPVAFFNTAAAGTSIDNWYRSYEKTRAMFSSNYANPISLGSTQTQTHPWGSTFDTRDPYLPFKNVLSLYGSMFGVRCVFWHQGEAETKTLLTQKTGLTYWETQDPIEPSFNINQYATKLNAMINDSRSILPGLTWAICKVSLISAIVRPTSSTYHYNITNSGSTLYNPNGSPTSYSVGGSVISQQSGMLNSYIVWASQNSDTYTAASYRAADGTHFNLAGLIAMANEVYGSFTSTLRSKSPIPPAAPAKVLVSGSSGSYTASTYYTYPYRWWYYDTGVTPINSFNQTQASHGSSVPYSTVTDGPMIGYAKSSGGRIYTIVPFVKIIGVSGARMASQENMSMLAFPNPVSDEDAVSINFELDRKSPVNILLMDEKGQVIHEINEVGGLAEGKHSYVIRMDPKLKINANKPYYLKVVTSYGEETKRIFLRE